MSWENLQYLRQSMNSPAYFHTHDLAESAVSVTPGELQAGQRELTPA